MNNIYYKRNYNGCIIDVEAFQKMEINIHNILIANE